MTRTFFHVILYYNSARFARNKQECGRMYKIMIVDDDPTSLAIGKALLEPAYKIVLMKSGIQALGYLKNNPIPDIILLDMVMPGTSGMDVLKALKEDPTLQDIPVIFLTSNDDNRLETEGLLLGAADLIQKPINPSLLKKKLEHQTEQIQLRLETRALKRRIEELEALVRQCASVLTGALSDSSGPLL